jgi:DNA-binding NarL/FixJ family response regulator
MSDQDNSDASRIRLLLVGDDPVFRLGLRVWLEQFSDIGSVTEADSGAIALDIVQPRTASETPVSASEPINFVLLELELGRSDPNQMQGLTLCQRIKAMDSSLPVLLLSESAEPVLMAAARQVNADGYATKQTNVDDLIAAIRQVAAGDSYWVEPPAQTQQPVRRESARPQPPRLSPDLISPFALMRRNLRLSGLRQIESVLADVTHQLETADLSLLDQAILAGRHRELRAAYWLVNRLLATPNLDISDSSADESLETPSTVSEPQLPANTNQLIEERQSTALPVVSDVRAGAIVGMQASLFDAVLAKVQICLRNQTNVPLEIDILREDKRRELLCIVLRKLADLLDELRYSEVQPRQLFERRSQLLLDLWQATIITFFGKYYVVQIDTLEVELVTVLRDEVDVVQAEILEQIPFADDLLAHLLFQQPLEVNSMPCEVGSPEAMTRAEELLDNLVIQVANAVIQPLLNRFSDVETIKQNFYDRRLMSSREIARFRNELSWRYRARRYLNEPKDIFESKYRLFVFRGAGIKQTTIYAPRRDQLEQLSGIPLVVTFALELRDAIAPRFRAVVSFVGSGVIYVLTDVIGRGIGLIGRGILKGIGNAWRDERFGKGDRSKS